MENNSGKTGVKKGCLWTVIVLQGLLLILVLIVIIGVMSVGKAMKNIAAGEALGEDEYPALEETWSSGSGKTKVVLIPLRGLITLEQEAGFFRSDAASASMVLSSIRRATHDPEVKAVILDIDSGGGSITASDVIYNALLEFKAAQQGRKVVAIFGDIAASGAYYVALPADKIIAHPTTITGSIGVLIQVLNIKGLGEKVGVKDVTIKSGRNKDLLNPFEDISEEQRAMLQEVIDEMHDRFVSLVSASRRMSKEEVADLADGRIFTASMAKDLGLVDQIGYWRDAVSAAAQLLKVDKVKVYRYEREFSLSTLLKGAQMTPPRSQLQFDSTDIRFLYLWQAITGGTK